MESLVKLVPLPNDILAYLGIDITLAILFLILIRWLSGVLSKHNVVEELSSRDNFAFGIIVAGSMLSFCVVLASAAGRHFGSGYEAAATSLAIFGVAGILLVKFGRYCHDKLVLNQLDTQQHIEQKNVSVAVVDAASLLSSAIVLASTMYWVTGSDTNAVIGMLSGYFVVLMILIITTRINEYRFARDNQMDSFQSALEQGQLALAVSHSGHLLGTAIIASSCASLLQYSPTGYIANITGWLFLATALTVLLVVLVAVTMRVVLFGVKYNQEIDHQGNLGIAYVECSISIGVALVVRGLLAFTM